MTHKVRNINAKPRTRYGVTYEHKESNEYHADIIPGKSVRIFGNYHNHVNGPKQFDLTFKVGDYAVYGSYNLTYTGEIIKIGKKTVTISTYGTGSRNKRLDLHTFCWRNWDYDAEKIAEYNLNESYYI